DQNPGCLFHGLIRFYDRRVARNIDQMKLLDNSHPYSQFSIDGNHWEIWLANVIRRCSPLSVASSSPQSSGPLTFKIRVRNRTLPNRAQSIQRSEPFLS